MASTRDAPIPVHPDELGARLRRARDGCGVSQEIAAAELGLSRAALSQIENGVRSLTGLDLDRVAFLYGRDVGEFFDDEFTPDDVVDGVRPSLGLDGGERRCIAVSRQIASLEQLLGIPSEVELRVAPEGGCRPDADALALRVLLLGLDAMRRAAITAAKFHEIASLVELDMGCAAELIAAVGAADEPVEVVRLLAE